MQAIIINCYIAYEEEKEEEEEKNLWLNTCITDSWLMTSGSLNFLYILFNK